MTNKTLEDLIREGKYKRRVPEPKIKDRWGDGIDHEPGTIELVELIGRMDFSKEAYERAVFVISTTGGTAHDVDPITGYVIKLEARIAELEKLYEGLMAMYDENFDDSLCIKTGGDGDNGETLAYILDALIENGLIEIKINDLSLIKD